MVNQNKKPLRALGLSNTYPTAEVLVVVDHVVAVYNESAYVLTVLNVKLTFKLSCKNVNRVLNILVTILYTGMRSVNPIYVHRSLS